MKVAIVGNPNSGKTSVFNQLTGAKSKVANYAGVTVALKTGLLKQDARYEIFDLPGLYSIHSDRLDEQATLKLLKSTKIDLILLVVDPIHFYSSKALLQELQTLSIPIVTVVNKVDLVKNKLTGNFVPISIKKNLGISFLIQQILNPNVFATDLDFTFDIRHTHSNLIDGFLLHPVCGSIAFLFILFVMFQLIFILSAIPQMFLQTMFSDIQSYLTSLAPKSITIDLLSNGIIAGVGTIITFLPQILIITVLMSILENTGYMARVAFLMDGIMAKVGLQGRSFISLLSSFSCAIPGIMATRTIDNYRQKLITILITPLMTCSARLPIYTILISAFIPAKSYFGIKLQGLVLLALFLIGIFSGLLVAFVAKKFWNIKNTLSIIELPDYQLPDIKCIVFDLKTVISSFLINAGTNILAITVVIWALSFPIYGTSVISVLAKFITPVFSLIGFNWQIVASLIASIGAREVIVSVLATIYGSNLITTLHENWSVATGLSLLAWYIYAPQCISTVVTIWRETNKSMAFITTTYQLFLAYIVSYCVYHAVS